MRPPTHRDMSWHRVIIVEFFKKIVQLQFQSTDKGVFFVVVAELYTEVYDAPMHSEHF